jgi:penicillin-binding protein 1C
MQMIYPSGHSAIRVPIELSGELGKVVFQVAHVRPSARIFWYLNEDLLGTTQRFHELAAQPPPGKHLLTLVDEEGSVLYYRFEVVARPSTGL